jgi:hypothetical protein
MNLGSTARIAIRLLALYMGIQGSLGVISQAIFALQIRDSAGMEGMPSPFLLVGLSMLPLLGAALLWACAARLAGLMVGSHAASDGAVTLSEPLIVRMMIAWAGVYLIATAVPLLVGLWVKVVQIEGSLGPGRSLGDMQRMVAKDSYLVSQLWAVGSQVVLGLLLALGGGGAARFVQWLAEARRA